MALEALSSNELLNFIIYDTISATPCVGHHHSSDSSSLLEYSLKPQEPAGSVSDKSSPAMQPHHTASVGAALELADRPKTLAVVQGRKKRRRRPRVCKNKEEAETQRMTHIAVERNRRRQMNDHLAVLRSLMPDSYIKRGDQASVVGGAIEFVKELEQLLQSLEAQKVQLPAAEGMPGSGVSEDSIASMTKLSPPPFSQFFVYPQYTWSQIPNKYTSKSKEATADIEVTLIETHANLRILLQRKPRQLSKMVIGFQTLHLTILHLNVTTLDQLVLYSISAKVEEECQLTSVDDIAGAVHHMLRIIEGEGALC
ncbi:transcription factor bHLH71-like isoform X2 [Malania oleifera]|uniref:transcription factor bHLH71-like isoform X2 n=1 Tax=Malania oleifera TaxID=397392 RepID=UPI0025ADC399|nr:transcription factor bHLH71-like isoform X2 [Malania oleifera]